MKSMSSRSFGIRESEGSLRAVRKATAELLADVARSIGAGDIDVPGTIVFRVERERFDCRVIAEFQPFNPTENLL